MRRCLPACGFQRQRSVWLNCVGLLLPEQEMFPCKSAVLRSYLCRGSSSTRFASKLQCAAALRTKDFQLLQECGASYLPTQRQQQHEACQQAAVCCCFLHKILPVTARVQCFVFANAEAVRIYAMFRHSVCHSCFSSRRIRVACQKSPFWYHFYQLSSGAGSRPSLQSPPDPHCCFLLFLVKWLLVLN